jgi:hypothetical protein
MLRKIVLTTICAILGLPALAAELDVYNQLTYRKIQPNQIQENVAMVERWVQPVQQDRVANNEITSWAMWRVRFPAGGDYDLVSVTVTDNYAAHAPGDSFRQAFDRVHGARNWQKFLNEIQPTGHVVRTEIWRQRTALGGTAENPDPFIRVNFVKATPGMEAEYQTLLDNLAGPFWTERLKTQGSSWSTWRLLDPGPAASPHNFATSTGFASFADAEPMNDVPAVFSRAHPDKNLQQVGERFRQASTQTRQEMWQLMLQTTAP